MTLYRVLSEDVAKFCRRVLAFAAILTCMLGAIFAMDFIQDPLALRLNTVPSRNVANNYDRIHKPWRVVDLKPDFAVVGSSLLEIGMDLSTIDSASKYNFAVKGTSIAESQLLFEHLTNAAKPHVVVLDVSVVCSGNREVHVVKDELLLDDDIRWLHPLIRLQNFVSLTEVGEVLRSKLFGERDELSAPGYDAVGHNLVDRHAKFHADARPNVAIHEWMDRAETYEIARFGRSPPQCDPEPLEKILYRAHHENVLLKLVFPPRHIRWMEAMYQLGHLESQYEAKRIVADMNSAVAKQVSKAPFDFYDFLTVNDYTTETILPDDPSSPVSTDWWEWDHFKTPVGDRIMERIFGKDAGNTERFGVLITSENIEKHLSLESNNQATWRRDHPEDVAELVGKVRLHQ